ncbi:MAG: hypothetical protein KatS3mg110_1952 [Pirellulaceae bacterium]|nr:MAG: hypothetical protein KatS3mg110_1952 [Pirellulaceae bacterium]
MLNRTGIPCPGALLVLAFVAVDVIGTRESSSQEELTLPQAIELLRAREPQAVIKAAELIGSKGVEAAEAVPVLAEVLEPNAPPVRVAILHALGKIGPKAVAAAPQVIARLDDPDLVDDTPVWQVASRTLAQMGPDVVPSLLPLLDPRHPQRYLGACAALEQLGPAAKPALPKLLELATYNPPDCQPALFVLRALGKEAKEALPTLMKQLDSPDFHTQYLACRVLGALGEHGQPATEKLCQLLAGGVASVRRNAAAALGQIGPSIGPEGITALIQAVSDPLEPVREEAVIALGRLGPAAASAVPVLKEAITTDRLAAKARAAGALYRIDPAEEPLVMAVLLRELNSPDAPWAAAEELAYVAPRAKRVADVAALLKAEHEETRAMAALALGGMGKAAEPYLAELERLAQDRDVDQEVREYAQEAIQKIRQSQ